MIKETNTKGGHDENFKTHHKSKLQRRLSSKVTGWEEVVSSVLGG